MHGTKGTLFPHKPWATGVPPGSQGPQGPRWDLAADFSTPRGVQLALWTPEKKIKAALKPPCVPLDEYFGISCYGLRKAKFSLSYCILFC